MNYEIIPQAPRYEMNQRGVLRNRETGKILKWTLSPKGTKTAMLCWNGKRMTVTQPHLLASRQDCKQETPRTTSARELVRSALIRLSNALVGLLNITARIKLVAKQGLHGDKNTLAAGKLITAIEVRI